jgi:hypothetical protein
MFEVYRRPWGRLFFLLLAVSGLLHAQAPPTTTVSDVVYRADGTPARGTLLISWPAFIAAGGQTVAAGTKSVTLGLQGALSVALVPNTGATPTTTIYTVVYQLDDGVKTEYWLVGTTSPTTIAAVRTVLGSGSVTQMASRQYVDTAVAATVHKSGTETIAGTKQFSLSPSVPTPQLDTDAVNKAYVDAVVVNSGNGSYVSKSGDTMTGPLTLPGEPGRMKLAEDRLALLERNDIRRSVYDRIVNAVITVAISAAIAMHDRWTGR